MSILPCCVLLLCAPLAVAAPVAGAIPYQAHPYSPAEYVKNYALIVCLAQAFPEYPALRRDLTGSARAYIELGRMPIEAYHHVYALSQSYLARQYRDMPGQKLLAMECLDFFHSQQLRQGIARFRQ